jgi:outer membrane murein-binding lipoprotein Lpp
MSIWLPFHWKGNTWEEAACEIEARMANTPGATDVTDQEAEELFMLAYRPAQLDRLAFRDVISFLGIKLPPKLRNQPGERAAPWLVRHWPNLVLRHQVVAGFIQSYRPAVTLYHHGYDESLLLDLIWEGFAPTFLCLVLRLVGHEQYVDHFLQMLPPTLRAHHRVMVAGSRIAVATLLTGGGEQRGAEDLGSLQQQTRHLQTRVQRREAELARLEAEKAAAARAVQVASAGAATASSEADALADAAREELATLQAQAGARSRARAAEMAERRAHYDRLTAAAEAEFAAARADFAAGLDALAGSHAWRPLAGHTVAVLGDPEARQEYRLLVAAAGGVLVEQDAHLVVATEPGCRIPAGVAGRDARVLQCPDGSLASLAAFLFADSSRRHLART